MRYRSLLTPLALFAGACSATDDAERAAESVASALSMAPSASAGDAEVANAYADWKSR